jgi:hypothetical protein
MEMVIQTKANTIPHWNYLLAIERDLAEVSRYVEFDFRNFKCFSIELAKILLSTGAETDVVCKQICRVVDPNSAADDIHKYRDQIKLAYPKIPQFTVRLPRFGLTLHPWDNGISPTESPSGGRDTIRLSTTEILTMTEPIFRMPSMQLQAF